MTANGHGHTSLWAGRVPLKRRPVGDSRGAPRASERRTGFRQGTKIKCSAFFSICFSRRKTWRKATAHPNHKLISSEDVNGTEVYGLDGTNVGEIDHLLIDKVSGRVAYAVMSFGGFMGLGHSHYPIPWSALNYDTSKAGFVTNITERQLKDAPEFSDNSRADRNWEAKTHQHYGAPVYWERLNVS